MEAESDACLVFLNEFSSEGWDRTSLADEESDDLVLNVASQCANTMVFIHNAGIRLVDAWIEHPNVTAVIFAHLPGQDAGRALISLIYGDVSPSGRLPYTVAKSASDYGSLLGPCPGSINNTSPQCMYITSRTWRKSGTDSHQATSQKALTSITVLSSLATLHLVMTLARKTLSVTPCPLS